MLHPANSALRVLLIEDSEVDAKLIRKALRTLQRDVTLECVQTAAAMRAALARASWDLIICDWSLPQFSAPAALALAHELNVTTPFIVVSGTIGEETAVEAMRAGARDYVLKANLVRLAPAIERELREDERRRSAEHALRVSQRRFERLADSGVIGICILDGTGRLHEANAACLALLGYEPRDIDTGLNWSALTPPEYHALDAKAAQHLREKGAAEVWEKQLLRRDGSRVSVLVGLATLEEDQCIAVLSDISERKLAEQRLHQSEERLRQVQKMEAIGSLAGGIAHDFNNILTLILSYSSLLKSGLEPADPRLADLEQIHEAGERAAALTQQLLAFSRRQVLQPEIVRLDALIRNMERMLRRLIGEHIELQVESADKLHSVRVDPHQFDQVIMNLAVNARDAMPEGGRLTIETRNVAVTADTSAGSHASGHLSPGEYVRMRVTDTGVGMDAATQARIFEPFFTTKEVGRGTGLGLATVLGIVQQSGGYIEVFSERGTGTNVDVYLPSNGEEPFVASAVASLASAPIPSGTETILLVEDDPSVQLLASAVLRRQGYEVLVANCGADALTKSAGHAEPIHLLLTDVIMPGLSGPQLATRIRAQRRGVPVLFMSGYADDALFEHGVRDDRFELLHKPFTPELLARRVRAVLDAVPTF